MQKISFLLLCGLICLGVGAAFWGQRNAPPGEVASSLEESTKIVQEGLSRQGEIGFASYLVGHDPDHFSSELTGVDVNPSACRISYHWKALRHGDSFIDNDFVLNLKDAQNIDVLTAEQYLKKFETVSNPLENYKVDPRVFVIQAQSPSGTQDFFFYDHATASRVARAMASAAKLCGGAR